MDEQAIPAFIDRKQWLKFRDRAVNHIAQSSFLFEMIADEFTERLQDVNRRFKRALIFGNGNDVIAQRLEQMGVESVVKLEPSPKMAQCFDAIEVDERIAPDPKLGKFDVILAPFFLHWLDDVPGALIRLHQALSPDGLFLAAVPCDDMLFELRTVLAEAEMQLEGGLSARVLPMASLRDWGSLLQRAGFALPVADRVHFTVHYRTPMTLMQDLRYMGEGNALQQRRRSMLRRDTLAMAIAQYHARFSVTEAVQDSITEMLAVPEDASKNKPVQATFELAYLTGWAPHQSQQKPLRPGSASMRLADALEAAKAKE